MMNELKTLIENFKNELNHTGERISDLEDRMFDIIHSEDWSNKRIK